MKHKVKPTLRQKKLIAEWGLDPRDWYVVKDTSEEMEIVHRYSDKTKRVLVKGV